MSVQVAVNIGQRRAGQSSLCQKGQVNAMIAWQNYSDVEGVHEADMGVELVTESGLVLELSWATPGREEGLALAAEPPRKR